MAKGRWQRVVEERWQGRLRSRPPEGPPPTVPPLTWRRRLSGLMFTVALVVCLAIWVAPSAAVLAAALYVVFAGLAEWLWRHYTKQSPGP